MYFMIAIRHVNQPLLEGGTEDEWEFGQTTAVILLGVAIIELVGHLKEYHTYNRYDGPDPEDPDVD
jgi:hypothetical protein